MSKIRIKNFGPIKEGYLEEDGWIDIKKVTVFIGNQGSGKSTVAKLISTFIWMEKALNRGDGQFSIGNDIIKLLTWQGLKDYIGENYEIEYIGERYAISYTTKASWPVIRKLDSGGYIVPKIMYVPSERNFLSTINDAFGVTALPGPLALFAEELKRSQIELKEGQIDLPFLDITYEYDKIDDMSYVMGEGYKINMLHASSGLQSLIPLYVVSQNLSKQIVEEHDPSNARLNASRSVRRDREISNIMLDKSLSSDEKSNKAEEVYAKYHTKCFINIVEEPEQNLFPTSQRKILDSLVEFNNMTAGNKLIMTTHSPYIINYLTLAVKAFKVREALKAEQKNADDKIGQIVPIQSAIDPNDLVIYELNEKDGTILTLNEYKGIPSDENYLNDSLAETNELFAQLQEIEKGWR